MSDWTFGIVTAGDQHARVLEVVDSILAMSEYDLSRDQIVVCGGSNQLPSEVDHVAFDATARPGWITKQKNLVVQHARNTNLILVHDYVVFDTQWKREFDNFGDSWDAAMCRIVNLDNKRFRDWIACEYIRPDDITGMRFLDYQDHSQIRTMCMSGTVMIAKTNLLLEHPLNENLMWGQGEDSEWSYRVKSFWNYRCNPKSVLKFLKQKPHHPPTPE